MVSQRVLFKSLRIRKTILNLYLLKISPKRTWNLCLKVKNSHLRNKGLKIYKIIMKNYLLSMEIQMKFLIKRRLFSMMVKYRDHRISLNYLNLQVILILFQYHTWRQRAPHEHERIQKKTSSACLRIESRMKQLPILIQICSSLKLIHFLKSKKNMQLSLSYS